ncbi:MAG: hypothetical protein HYY25_05405 [Candidatus Wallbacteria bacterium]|nr:hypothetical protein [Candidatus Wallbacteria bacterium]
MAAVTKELIPSLVIGLGGTGYQVVKILKRKYLDSAYFGNAVPELIRMVTIDQDPNLEEKGEDLLTTHEKIYITADVGAVVANIEQHPYLKRWYPAHAVRESIGPGAGQVRAVGRLRLFKNMDLLRNVLEDRLRKITDKKHIDADGAFRMAKAKDADINVFIVTSVGGGTGSGMFLDMAYIVREVFRREKKRAILHGYLFMPDALAGRTDEENERMNANGAAALRELDFFMDRKERFKAEYSDGFKISEQSGQEKPFNFCYLVSDVDVNDRLLLQKVTAEQIFHIMGTALTKDQQSVMANVPAKAFLKITDGQFKGKERNYSSFGVSSCVFPMERLREIFAHQFGCDLLEMIQEFPKDEKKPKPWDQDLDDFLHLHGLIRGLEGQEQDLMAIDRLSTIQELKTSVAVNIDNIGVSDLGKVVVDCNGVSRRSFQDLAKRIAGRKAELIATYLDGLNRGLAQMFGDPDKGVRYVQKFLESLKVNLEELRGLMKRGRDFYQKKQTTATEQARAAEESLRTECDKSFLLRSRSLCRQYAEQSIKTSNTAIVFEFKADLQEWMHEVLIALAQKVDESLVKVHRLAGHIERLETQFQKRSIEVTLGGDVNGSSQDYLLNYSVVKSSDLKGLYAGFLGELAPYEAVYTGSEQGLDLASKWGYYSENVELFERDTLKFASRFLEKKLNEVTIEEFLISKGHDYIADIGENLAKKGKPLWRLDDNLFPHHVHTENFLGVYDREGTRLVEHVAAILGENFVTVSTREPHRVTLVQTGHGAPLFALSKIEDWESRYRRYRDIQFLHAVTGEEYGIDWHDYPLRPNMFTEQELIRYFTLARPLGFLQMQTEKDKNRYYLTLEPARAMTPGDPRNTFLGDDLIASYDRFKGYEHIRKLAHMINQALYQRGSYQDQLEFLETEISRLKSSMAKLASPPYQKFFQEQITAVVPVRDDLVRKKTLSELERDLAR